MHVQLISYLSVGSQFRRAIEGGVGLVFAVHPVSTHGAVCI
jgi:hypothetical protein